MHTEAQNYRDRIEELQRRIEEGWGDEEELARAFVDYAEYIDNDQTSGLRDSPVELCSRSLEIYKRLYPRPIHYTSDAAKNIARIARMYVKNEQFIDASALYESLLEYDRPVYSCEAAGFIIRLASSKKEAGMTVEAEKLYCKALSLFSGNTYGDSQEVRLGKATALTNLARIHQSAGDAAAAEKEYRESLSIYRGMDRPRYAVGVALTLNDLANLHIQQKNMKEAEKELREELAIYRGLAEKNPEIYDKEIAKITMRMRSMDMQVPSQDYGVEERAVKPAAAAKQANFVKLTRCERAKQPGVYDIEPYSLCKLVDALSTGEVIKYYDLAILFNHFGVGSPLTISRFAKFLSEKLSAKDRRDLFGRVTLDSYDDLRSHFKQSETLRDKDAAADEFKRYLLDHYDFDGKAFTRKAGSKYINV